MKFRIVVLSNPNGVSGYVVQVQTGFWIFKKWKTFIKASGLDSPWYHLSYSAALNSLIEQIVYETRFNTNTTENNNA